MSIAFERVEQNEDPIIQIYNIQTLPPSKHSQIKLQEEIILMDFSEDGNYMICQDKNFNCTYHHFKQKEIQSIDILGLQTNIQWMSEGLKLCQKVSKINHYYTHDNEITNIIKFNTTILVTDQIGTIRIYEYPCDTSFYRVYSNHLCDINIASAGEKYLVTSSSYDRTIIIWEMLTNKK